MAVSMIQHIIQRVCQRRAVGVVIGCVLMMVVSASGQEWVDYSSAFGTNESVGLLKVDPQGHLWVTTASGLWTFDGEMWQLSIKKQDLPLPPPPNDIITGLVFDRLGRMWLGTPSALSRWDGQEWVSVPFDSTHGGMLFRTISPAVADSVGHIWGIDRGLGRAANSRRIWRFDGERFEFPINFGGEIQQLVIDGAGRLWIAAGGVTFFDGQQLHFPYTDTTDVFYEIWDPIREWRWPSIAINPHDGSLWAAFGSGAARFDGERWTTYPIGDYYNTVLKKTVTVLSFETLAPAPDGTMWFAGHLTLPPTPAIPDSTILQVFHFDGTNWWEYPPPAKFSFPRIVVDGDGRVWVAGFRSLFRLRPPIITGIEDVVSNALPQSVQLFQNVPNPFNEETTIRYTLSEAGWVRLVIYDTRGQVVSTLIHQHQTPGIYHVRWGGERYGSGIYVYRLQVGRHVEWKRMVLLK